MKSCASSWVRTSRIRAVSSVSCTEKRVSKSETSCGAMEDWKADMLDRVRRRRVDWEKVSDRFLLSAGRESYLFVRIYSGPVVAAFLDLQFVDCKIITLDFKVIA